MKDCFTKHVSNRSFWNNYPCSGNSKSENAILILEPKYFVTFLHLYVLQTCSNQT